MYNKGVNEAVKTSGSPQLDAFLNTYQIRLNDQQREAVGRTEGNTLLLAVPGSGKTTVIIARCAYLIEAMHVDPERILTLTFSRASAADLKNRYLRDYAGAEKIPRFSTIHSFALSVIRRCEKRIGKKAFDVLASNQGLIAEVYRQMKGQRPGESEMAEITSKLTYVKNLMLTSEEIDQIECQDFDFPKFYRLYEKEKKRRRLMDFDDLLVYAYRLLKKDPGLLREYRSRYDYINIDEAQDTSKIQHAIIRFISTQTKSLFMVGDEDQSIYGFRGAYPEGLLSFEKDYPNSKVLLMETNFRSTGRLVRQADQFIRLNEGRYDKHLRSSREEGLSPVQEYFKNEEAMYHYILESVRRENKETAILYRNNESAIALIDLFEREGVPYRLKEHTPVFFSNFLLRDLRDFYEFSKHPDDFDLFTRICFKNSARISKDVLTRLTHTEGNIFHALRRMNLPDWLMEDVEDLEDALRDLGRRSAADALDTILYEVGYMNYLEYRIQNGLKREVIQQKLDILKTIARRESSLDAFFSRLDELRGIISTRTEQTKGPLLSTIHSSKGLEFEKVMMLDVYDGILPAPGSGDEEEEKREYLEEVRLFYVGVTRAKDELVFLSLGSKKRQPVGRLDSPFIRAYLKPISPHNTKKSKKLSKKR